MRITKYNVELNANHVNVLVKESAVNYQAGCDAINSTDTFRQILCDVFHLDRKAEEYVYMLAMDCKGHLIGVFEVSHGAVNGSICSPKEIYVRALLCGASSIMLAHNHPSGDPTPSDEDLAVTKKVNTAGKFLNVPLVDHMIIGADGKYYSFCEDGKIER